MTWQMAMARVARAGVSWSEHSTEPSAGWWQTNGAEAKTRRCLSQGVREFAQALCCAERRLTGERRRERNEMPARV
jgi:hypothetical protein